MTAPQSSSMAAHSCVSPVAPALERPARAEAPPDSNAQPGCLHTCFEAQAAMNPRAIAVVFGDDVLTYEELNARANHVARRLAECGVGPETRVGLCARRSLEMIVGLLGILKAGAAYVPVDPSYPKDRIAFMLSDAQVPVLLTLRSQRESLPAHHAKALCLDDDAFRPDSASRIDNPASAVTPDNLAYVIYTSGSTGRPKGVMVCHRNVTNFFRAMDEVIGVEPGVWLAVTSISFDISILELFWTLARGFKVVIQPEDWSAEPRLSPDEKPGEFTLSRSSALPSFRSIAEQIVHHGVTHFQCTPSQAAILVEDTQTLAALRQLKKIFVGGEALPSALARRLAGCAELYNMYGPTETTIWSTAARITADCDVTIGRPILNTFVLVAGPELQPVASGEAGELLIGGEGVARGYLGRPELTAERFVAIGTQNSSSAQNIPELPASRPGALRFYRTGDLVRLRPDGNLEFLGRLDHQVKIRGHRVELGEIEAVLAQHPSVRRVVVMAREDHPGDQRLVAYVVPREENAARPDGAGQWFRWLKAFAKEHLPEYMIPSAFVSMDALPLTPNGKIDRKALPQPPPVPADTAAPFEAAASGLEKQIAAIWREVLRVERAGLDDNFFDLGGHSLLVTQVQLRLREQLGRDLPITRLFQFPTIRSLAKFLGEQGDTRETFSNVRARASRQRAAFGGAPVAIESGSRLESFSA